MRLSSSRASGVPSWPSTAADQGGGIEARGAVDVTCAAPGSARTPRPTTRADERARRRRLPASQPIRRRRAVRVKRRTSARSSRLRAPSAAANSARAVRGRAGWAPRAAPLPRCDARWGADARRGALAVRPRGVAFDGRGRCGAAPVGALDAARPGSGACVGRGGSPDATCDAPRVEPRGAAHAVRSHAPRCGAAPARAPRAICGTIRYTSPQLRVITMSPSRASVATESAASCQSGR